MVGLGVCEFKGLGFRGFRVIGLLVLGLGGGYVLRDI